MLIFRYHATSCLLCPCAVLRILCSKTLRMLISFPEGTEQFKRIQIIRLIYNIYKYISSGCSFRP
jgi:hypothetical protein